MAFTEHQWSAAVIAAGEEYAAGRITFAELQRRLLALRSDEAMALIDAVDEAALLAENQED